MKWEHPIKELKDHTWDSIILACEPSLILHEIKKQWYQKYSLEEPLGTTKLIKIISSLCDDNSDDSISADPDIVYNFDCNKPEYYIKYSQEDDNISVISDSDTECNNKYNGNQYADSDTECDNEYYKYDDNQYNFDNSSEYNNNNESTADEFNFHSNWKKYSSQNNSDIGLNDCDSDGGEYKTIDTDDVTAMYSVDAQ